jgi:hypothetical protein
MEQACSHPPREYFTWHAYDCITNKNDWLVICCKACHQTIKGDSTEYEAYLFAHNVALP